MAITATILADVLESEKKGQAFSSVSVTALAVKKALDEDSDFKETLIQLIREHQYVVEDKSLLLWAKGSNHYPYNSFDSDSATRAAYIGEFYDDFEEMQSAAAMIAGITHNHPEGIKGAVVAATCVWMAKRGYSKEDIYRYVKTQYPWNQYEFSIANSLEEICYKDRDGDAFWQNTCQCCVPLAMRCFYESDNYESFVENVNSLPFDSRVLRAISGGVAEEYFNDFYDSFSGEPNIENDIRDSLSADLYEIYSKNHVFYAHYIYCEVCHEYIDEEEWEDHDAYGHLSGDDLALYEYEQAMEEYYKSLEEENLAILS